MELPINDSLLEKTPYYQVSPRVGKEPVLYRVPSQTFFVDLAARIEIHIISFRAGWASGGFRAEGPDHWGWVEAV